MKTSLSAASILLLLGTPAVGHRLDEYLQATLITVEKDRVHAQIRLIPGIVVLPIVLGSIDTDGDKAISEAEQGAYAERVLRDLSLTLDGDRLRLRLVSTKFPKLEEMQQGLGEIELQFDADVPRVGSNRKLIFENRHQRAIATYLVNCLVPEDPGIRIGAQNRNYQQSYYELDYLQGGAPVSLAWFSSGSGWVGMVALVLTLRFAFLWWRRSGVPAALR